MSARPFLSPAIEQSAEAIAANLKAAWLAAFGPDIDPAQRRELDAIYSEALARHLKKALETVAQRVGYALRGKSASVDVLGQRQNLEQQVLRDEREEAVEEVLDECCQSALASGMGMGDGIVYADMEGQVRSILLTAANLWGIGSDQASAE